VDAGEFGGALLPSGLSFTVTSSAVPEPSTIALGVMGASAFLLRLRMKRHWAMQSL
jgi:hypothetical protein